jgi:adenylate cyclase
VRELYAELKRRHVVRVVIAYIVLGWVFIEAAATILPALGAPEWVVPIVTALVLLGFPVAAGLGWAFDVTPQGIRRTPRLAGEGAPRGKASPPAAAGEPEKSIAVLPFLNMSDDRDNEYFSDGMTEEILNALVKVRELRVASRTSSFTFKGKDLDIREIGERLGVATVLEGSVRKAAGRIRVTAQLIDIENGYHLWSETYDRELEDVFAIQDEIARAIVGALKVRLLGDAEQPLIAPTTDSLEAYTLYLKGRFYMNKSSEPDLHRAVELFQQALTVDPHYAHAFAGIADSWMFLSDDWIAPGIGYPNAKKAALKALEIDPGLAEAHTELGKVLGWYEWNFDAGELALRRAVAANPQYADAHWALGSMLPPTGRIDESVDEIRTALRLDPLSPTFSRWLARLLRFARRYDEALDQARATLELDPRHHHAWLEMGHAYIAQDQPERALEAFRRGSTGGDIAFFDAHVACALAAIGDVDEARSIVERLSAASGEMYVRPEAIAAGWGALGDLEAAFEWLDRALEARSAGLIYLNVDSAFDPLRDDPRFGIMLQKIGLRPVRILVPAGD